ncbi:hypothetical protein NC651_003659 [Populus alba x Populus x berolinensis]|nr:hypothetical protein NC651_003659 [Populus alba x Populus x berolinensis]
MFYYTCRRISDITGRGSSFPPLSNMDSIKTLKRAHWICSSMASGKKQECVCLFSLDFFFSLKFCSNPKISCFKSFQKKEQTNPNSRTS